MIHRLRNLTKQWQNPSTLRGEVCALGLDYSHAGWCVHLKSASCKKKILSEPKCGTTERSGKGKVTCLTSLTVPESQVFHLIFQVNGQEAAVRNSEITVGRRQTQLEEPGTSKTNYFQFYSCNNTDFIMKAQVLALLTRQVLQTERFHSKNTTGVWWIRQLHANSMNF